MATLELPDCHETAVWRLTKARLAEDAVLQASGITLEFFEGAGSIRDLSSLQGPALRFYPQLGRLAWSDEQHQSGDLTVGIEAVLFELDPEDGFNLMAALVQALYPDDDQVYHLALVTAGATTGLWGFPQRLGQPQSAAGRDHVFRLTGSAVLQVESGTLQS